MRRRLLQSLVRRGLLAEDDAQAMEFLLDKIRQTKNNANFYDSLRRG